MIEQLNKLVFTATLALTLVLMFVRHPVQVARGPWRRALRGFVDLMLL